MSLAESGEAAYNEKIPTQIADRGSFSTPLAILRQIGSYHLHGMARNDSERYDALEKAGFRVERYGDIAYTIYERQGGHYMDVGTSAKIAKGLVSELIQSPSFLQTPS